MKRISNFLTAIAFAITLGSCTSTTADSVASYDIIPAVKSVNLTENGSFTLNGKTVIAHDGENGQNAQFLADYVEIISGKKLPISDDKESKGAIVLTIDTNIENEEGYTINVTKDGVIIAGKTPAGVFYGIQTLRKSLPTTVSGSTIATLPAATIEDAPRFSYRGVHLDVGRHYFDVTDIKKFIDMLSLHNMNRLHWHLTEDQGWRIEIKKYPLLTEIGSKRKETVIGRNSGKYDGKPYEGFYTQEEIKDIVAYAAEQNITIVPEIDLPGHMQAALSAYPQYGCTGGPYEVWTQWGVSDNVLCAGNEATLKFVEDILEEVIELFPSEYIHIGGDECPKTQWAKCPKCQARIKSLGIKGDKAHSKEEYLQSYVIKRMEKFINSKGRKIIGWDEILEGGLSETATVMSWRGEGGGIQAAKMGNNVIMTPNSYLYFDYYQSSDTENEPLAIGGYLPIEKVYSYEPMPERLSKEEQSKIVGVQANLWTEYMPTYSQVEYMALPRMAALAEIQWSEKSKKDYDSFLARIPRLINYYDIKGYNYAKHLFFVDATYKSDPEKSAISVEFSTLDNADIHYTLDGSEPTVNSPKYNGELIIKENCTVTATAIRNGESSRLVSEKIDFSKSSAKHITANQPVNKQYEFNGVSTLVDGLKGNGNYKTGRWIAFYRNDMDVTIDLGTSEEISSLSLSTCVEKGDWVFDLRSLKVEVSEDGKEYKVVSDKTFPAMKENDRNGLYNHEVTFDKTSTRYVKVYGASEQSIPAWHGGKGNPGFLFVDEISIN